jgi:hypothetical protein
MLRAACGPRNSSLRPLLYKMFFYRAVVKLGRIEKTTPSKPVLIEKSKKDFENENKTFDGYNDNDVTKKTATLGGATYRDYLVNKKNSRLPFHQQHQYAKKLGCFTYKEIIITYLKTI